MTKNVDTFFQKNSKRPLKALWDALNEATPDFELPMAIVMDSRCGIERKVVVEDGLSDDAVGLQMEGATPLTLAVRAHRLSRHFWPSEPIIMHRSIKGTSVFMMAALGDNVTAMELLAGSGADIEKVDSVRSPSLCC